MVYFKTTTIINKSLQLGISFQYVMHVSGVTRSDRVNKNDIRQNPQHNLTF